MGVITAFEPVNIAAKELNIGFGGMTSFPLPSTGRGIEGEGW